MQDDGKGTAAVGHGQNLPAPVADRHRVAGRVQERVVPFGPGMDPELRITDSTAEFAGQTLQPGQLPGTHHAVGDPVLRPTGRSGGTTYTGDQYQQALVTARTSAGSSAVPQAPRRPRRPQDPATPTAVRVGQPRADARSGGRSPQSARRGGTRLPRPTGAARRRPLPAPAPQRPGHAHLGSRPVGRAPPRGSGPPDATGGRGEERSPPATPTPPPPRGAAGRTGPSATSAATTKTHRRRCPPGSRRARPVAPRGRPRRGPEHRHDRRAEGPCGQRGPVGHADELTGHAGRPTGVVTAPGTPQPSPGSTLAVATRCATRPDEVGQGPRGCRVSAAAPARRRLAHHGGATARQPIGSREDHRLVARNERHLGSGL